MSRLTSGMTWFKRSFANPISRATKGTPYTLSFLTALATQETYEIWGNVYDKLPVSRVLQVCVGDVLDTPRRSAFPKNKADLLTNKNGAALFAVARNALEDMAQFNATYERIAHLNPDKFCHGFGIFQYDLQFSERVDPDFFLNKRWYDIDTCLDKCLSKLERAQARAKLAKNTTLSDTELAYVAIAYNCGSFDPKKGLKQGFKDSTGQYYGELIYGFIQTAAQIPDPK